MQKYISLAVMVALMGMSLIDPVSVSLRLPQQSNVYPDTFAIYWQFDRPYSTDELENILVKIELSSMFGNELTEIDADDSLVSIPFLPDYVYEDAMVVAPHVTKTIVTPRDNPPGRSHLLKVIQKRDKQEALIALVRTKPRLENLLLLADSYEEEKCYVNAFYIYKRMSILYPTEGAAYLAQFYSRHRSELMILNGVER